MAATKATFTAIIQAPLRELLLQEYLNFVTPEGSKWEAAYFSDAQLFSRNLKCIVLSSHTKQNLNFTKLTTLNVYISDTKYTIYVFAAWLENLIYKNKKLAL